MTRPALHGFFSVLDEVLTGSDCYPLHQPEFQGNEWIYVKDCLDTGWVSSVGSYVDRFEQGLQSYTGMRHAIASVNGTAALHTCLLLCDVQPGDEVLLPTFTFVATANAVRYCAADPHLVDISPATLGVDPIKLAAYLDSHTRQDNAVCINRHTGRPIRALIVMHAFGHPAEMDQLQQLCEQHNLALIEDAAEALGSFYRGRHVGHWGRVTALSFNGNKIITTGGGGAILTNNEDLAKKARHITTTAKLPHAWEFVHDEVGYNYRLPNLNAALGCAQLELLPRFVGQKRQLASRYQQLFAGSALGHLVTEPADTHSNYWLNCFVLEPQYAGLRDQILEQCHERHILARPAWELMHRLPMYQACPRMNLSHAEQLQATLISLPSSPVLGAVA